MWTGVRDRACVRVWVAWGVGEGFGGVGVVVRQWKRKRGCELCESKEDRTI